MLAQHAPYPRHHTKALELAQEQLGLCIVHVRDSAIS
jgi:hypothetical protein